MRNFYFLIKISRRPCQLFCDKYNNYYICIIIMICIDNIEQGCAKIGCQGPLGSARAQP